MIMLQNDYEAFQSFMDWLEEHNYCKVVHCCHCTRWKPYEWDLDGYCSVNHLTKHYDDWCSDAAEESMERIMKHGKK